MDGKRYLRGHEVEDVGPDELVAYEGNAKRHTREQLDAVEASVREFGFRNPVLAWHDERGRAVIVAGHARCEVARRLGMPTVPVLWVDDLDDARRRALTLADNQTTMMTGWDADALAAELDALSGEMDMGSFGFDLDGGDEPDDRYSQNVGHVDYEPSDRVREPSELYSRPKDYSDEIEALDAPEGIKELCRLRNAWLAEFDFAKIADYYCNQATPEVQRVFERLALVLLDRDQLIENGFADLLGDVLGGGCSE